AEEIHQRANVFLEQLFLNPSIHLLLNISGHTTLQLRVHRRRRYEYFTPTEATNQSDKIAVLGKSRGARRAMRMQVIDSAPQNIFQRHNVALSCLRENRHSIFSALRNC